MSDSSDNHEHVESTGVEAASSTEQTDNSPAVPEAKPYEEKSSGDDFKSFVENARKKAEETGAVAEGGVKADREAQAQKATEEAKPPGEGEAAEKPGFQANFKYKAFGKEKELDDFWKPLIKDPESEKKVKDVFTRADAFDEMKSRYENTSHEQQRTLQQFTALDRDVKRVTTYLNNGDYDNFFSALNISDQMLLEHLQNKADIQKLSPMQQQQYQQGVRQRAEMLMQQESHAELQNNYATQAVQTRTMQLEMVLSRPEVERTASAFDSLKGMGAFRDLVTETARNHWYQTKEDLPADKAVQMTLDRWGPLIAGAQSPQSAAPVAPTQSQQPAAAPQGQQGVVMNQGKPVIPNVKGRGTSPVAQSPKSLDEMRKMGRRLNQSDAYSSY